ncbi:MAG: sigma-54-dependent Fis family transcriptional regulator [Pirellulaceae bacterium]|nr:sigma-54-dependent Fis family transcriptional regulator [Pirellulaceae bacterium]
MLTTLLRLLALRTFCEQIIDFEAPSAMELTGQRILIVDDEPLFLQTTCQLLQKEGANCQTAVDAATALLALANADFDLILTDLNMPGNLRWELLQAGRQRWSHVPMIVITGVPSLPSAIESLRLGVTDYLLKPVGFPELLASIRRALAARPVPSDSDHVRPLTTSQPVESDEIIGNSPAMRELNGVLQRIAQTSAHVLISGETGTGKELAARAIHRLSTRQANPFVVVDCNAVQPSDVSASLFGAGGPGQPLQTGMLLNAKGGCLFLDEVAALPLSFQPKLLRVVQNQEFVPPGSQSPVPIDVRFISSTQSCIETEVAAGRFRQDLYYRLGVLSLRLPPLRERGDDVLLLAQHFWKLARPIDGDAIQLTRSARSALLSYQWPGNVRELRNVIQRVATLTNDSIVTIDDLAGEIATAIGHKPAAERQAAEDPTVAAEPLSDTTFHQRRAKSEREYLMELMEANKGNVTQAARRANMSRQGFHKLLKRHGLAAANFRSENER